MSELTSENRHPTGWNSFLRGCIAILPLSLAVLPWGILAGSMAIESGMTPAEGVGMSAIIFAGATQLAAMGMIKAGAGVMAIMVSAFFISSQHLLYSLTLRDRIAPLPLRWRLILGFLLTDELFALIGKHSAAEFDRWYALGVGLFFYIFWLLSTLAGVLAATQIENLGSYGLDFSIAATFIVIVVPLIKNIPTIVCVLTALILSIVLGYFHVPSSLIISGVTAMFAGLITSLVMGDKE
ncbi:AzlC family ABC transporter permease [Budviciaceae bacterium CWB-B4]|uniref:AzlC family ABC transporter permease n=1 Tax=Limnobaculum xujianqingii TaxID=2738837 RepID=A0A9D7ALE9_9GAMM|nr:AzlC family ABC transporter permease [Limnobaculum xujianqingii]MBK5074988.1 AzlC family ABC transporter permease [Limnobaculum xujianqingii]MBK5178298.1 AzlC family ABC transporter permease [Limnobaculum xujianqingii]